MRDHYIAVILNSTAPIKPVIVRLLINKLIILNLLTLCPIGTSRWRVSILSSSYRITITGSLCVGFTYCPSTVFYLYTKISPLTIYTPYQPCKVTLSLPRTRQSSPWPLHATTRLSLISTLIARQTLTTFSHT